MAILFILSVNTVSHMHLLPQLLKAVSCSFTDKHDRLEWREQ